MGHELSKDIMDFLFVTFLLVFIITGSVLGSYDRIAS